MKISLNTIRSMIQRDQMAGDIMPDGYQALAERIGAQLGAIEEIETIGEKYNGIVVARVAHCRKHENSDHLNICLVDDAGKTPDVTRNEQGLVQVVCGAPNVREGLLVAWLPPGSTVPESIGKDPFVLEARELRGELSNGMLASPRELALGDSHEGILEIIDPSGRVQPGDDFAEVFGLKDDVLFDIENKMFTHRPDCFGYLGVSRELAGIQQMSFHSPSWYNRLAEVAGPEADMLPLQVTNELPELVPRFTAVALRDVTVGPSPTWLVVELAKVGLRSINNIVDYTNFFMLQTGQPLHAYDYDKVKALSDGDVATIVVRNPKPGEKIMLLNGKEIEPRAEAIMIATDKQLIGVGGVMGGGETEVNETTKNIIIECATFDMYSIRRTAMAHGLFTDAVTRFNKGQSPLQNLAVLSRIVNEVREFAAGKVASELVDMTGLKNREWVHPPVPVTTQFINERLGFNLSADDTKLLLENVEFDVAAEGDSLTVTAPFWRTDIETREDVVEEVGRLYGFDKLPLKLPMRSIKPAERDAQLELKARIRNVLAKAGANEVLGYSFVHGGLLSKVGQDTAHAFRLDNALSPDLQYYRLSLTPSLLEKVHPNIKAGYDQFALFEIGKAHTANKLDEAGLPVEFDRLALVCAARKQTGAAYYQARLYLEQLLTELGITKGIAFEPLAEDDQDIATTYYLPGRSATITVDGTVIGRIGEYAPAVRRSLKLPDYCAGFEIGLAPLAEHPQQKAYTVLPRFPKVTQDMTLKVPADTPYQTLYDCLQQAWLIDDNTTYRTLTALDMYQRADDPDYKQITFRFTVANYERTLTDAEVSTMLEHVSAAAETTVHAQLA